MGSVLQGNSAPTTFIYRPRLEPMTRGIPTAHPAAPVTWGTPTAHSLNRSRGACSVTTHSTQCRAPEPRHPARTSHAPSPTAHMHLWSAVPKQCVTEPAATNHQCLTHPLRQWCNTTSPRSPTTLY
ncbi:hypothetical protein PIB30_055722 [Stylosanthes scabra]|uniref:Uncharacterized protein n=1 Tax=Stylosanthes scabra TaxID=79078 RepID=A0ABU6YJC2_9FABA|nr:hypothetical protein [Stylosanthes scabra]